MSDREMVEKELRVRRMMDSEGLDAVVMSSISNFAWFTCGGSSHVSIATETGAASVVVTRDSKYIVCDNIEARRIQEEEVAGQGFEFRTCYWFDDAKSGLIREIAGGGALGSDSAMEGARCVGAALDACRASLTPEEVERYVKLGKDIGESLSLTARETDVGMSEHDIAAVLNHHITRRGAIPVVTLIAVDDRISSHRHPIPTDKKLERCAMLVTGARRGGLILSATRMLHFGARSPELRCKHEAVARVDAEFIAATVPGARIGDIFDRAVRQYALTGFAEEWKLHHQGGPTGYKGREFRATQATDALVAENQAFAWNPSITGAKTEDTVIATSAGPIILSETEDWPKIEFEVDGRVIKRPEMLIR